jgi:hypothetical protein
MSMNQIARPSILFILAVACAGVGCASVPAQSIQERERTIEQILHETSDQAEYTQRRRCLAGADYDDFRVLDDKRIVFEGRRGQPGQTQTAPLSRV